MNKTNNYEKKAIKSPIIMTFSNRTAISAIARYYNNFTAFLVPSVGGGIVWNGIHIRINYKYQ